MTTTNASYFNNAENKISAEKLITDLRTAKRVLGFDYQRIDFDDERFVIAVIDRAIIALKAERVS